MRLSEYMLSKNWLAQFRTSKYKALGAQLLNQLKIVSAVSSRQVLNKQTLTELQTELQASIAVYPIAPPVPHEIAGYDPFTGRPNPK